MRLPDFLIIGAMKAGTTTLFRDLETNPGIFFPRKKELGHLTRDEVLTEAGRRDYARHFRRARADQKAGEASTDYTKLPTYPGCPRRVRELLGPDVRLIYLVREPIARTVSQHHHSYNSGKLPRSFDEALERNPTLLEYSRYAMQLEPWLETFGREAVMVIRFEDYVANRQATADAAARFVGVTDTKCDVDETRVFNKSKGHPVTRGAWCYIRDNPIYRRILWPMLPAGLIEWVRHTFLPRIEEDPIPPSPETLEKLAEALEPEVERFRALLGRTDAFWNMAATLEQRHKKAPTRVSAPES